MLLDTASGNSPCLELSDAYVESFLRHLTAAGYAERTLRKKRSILASFARWTRRKQVAVEKLDESHLSAFAKRSPRRSKNRVAFELSVVRLFLEYLRFEAGVTTPPACIDSSPANELKKDYIDYLRRERGLAERSIYIYLPFVRAFLAEQVTHTSPITLALDAEAVRDFLLDRVRGRSTAYLRLLASALRSFLRFLYSRGETTVDLSPSVPTVRSWSQAQVHPFLSPEEVTRVLSATDRSTASGRRDHAILLLLAQLGLRAGEIVALELGDIRWRTGEILVRGKNRVKDRLPLLSDVGEALVLYLRKDRGSSTSRRVFLRMWAPRVGLSGPAAVGHVVRAALARAGVRRPGRGAAHLFRHSLATTMIRQGASIAEISEVLRHRSQSTTTIYAKVDLETLREVARPWPRAAGTP